MQRLRFSISISADQFLRYYAGSADKVIVTADDGRRIQLPANSFRRFVTQEGISGEFELTLDQNNKLVDLRRL